MCVSEDEQITPSSEVRRQAVGRHNWATIASPQGMDIEFLGREFEDIEDWCERMRMAAAIRDFGDDKLFMAAKLNLKGKAREWYKRLEPKPANWFGLETLLKEKYGKTDTLDIKMRLDAIKQEGEQRV